MKVWVKLLDPVIWYPVLAVLGLILIDTVLGVLVSIKKKEFRWNKLSDWLSKIGIQISGLVVLGLISIFQKEVWIALAPAIMTLSATTIKTIIEKIQVFAQ